MPRIPRVDIGDEIYHVINRGKPFGSDVWSKGMIEKYGLKATVCKKGRPKKVPDPFLQDFFTKMAEAKKTSHMILQPEPFSRKESDAGAVSVGDFVVVTTIENVMQSLLAEKVEFHAPISAPTGR